MKKIKERTNQENSNATAVTRLPVKVERERRWQIPLAPAARGEAKPHRGPQLQFSRRVDLDEAPLPRLSLIRSVADTRLRRGAPIWGR